MKPFQMIVIGACGLLAVVGLYVFATMGSGTSNSVGTVVIWGTLPSGAVTDAVNALKTANKQYVNVSYVQQPAAGFDDALANAIASGQGPDLVIINQEQLITEAAKITVIPFSSISERTYLDTYVGEDELFLTSSGTYGIPLVIDPLVLYYNKTLLASAGVPTPPTTWEAVTGLASLLTKRTAQGITQSTVPFGSYANVNDGRAIVSALLIQAGSSITSVTGSQLRSTIGAPSSDTSPAPAASAMNFYTQFANPAKTVYSWDPSFPSSRQSFIGGDLALYPGYASEVADIRAENPNLSFDMAPLPQAGSGPTKSTYGLAYAFVIPKAAGNKAGAYATAMALTSASILPNLAQELGVAPATRSMLTPSASDPYASIIYPQALIATGWLSPAPVTVDGIFAAIITNIATGRMTTDAALNAGDQSLNAAL